MPRNPKFAVALMLSLAALTPLTAQAQFTYGQPLRLRQRSTNRTTTRRSSSSSSNRTNTAKKGATKKKQPDLEDALNKLNLTPAQRTQIDVFKNKADAAGKKTYDDRTLAGQQVIDKMSQVNHDLISSIKSVLTPEQETKFESLWAEAKG